MEMQAEKNKSCKNHTAQILNMGIKAYSQTGDRMVDSGVLLAADKLLSIKKDKPLWDVIDEVVSIWISRHPDEWKSNIIRIDSIRNTRSDKKFASSKDKGSYLRYTIDVPQAIISMIRVLYDADTLNMDKDFWRKFGRRYKAFMIPEKM